MPQNKKPALAGFFIMKTYPNGAEGLGGV